jgi:NAD(P)-dependent dehydrogenase (short-subunit alcohol dehydrogenase family)
MLCSQAVIKGMIDRSYGRIINVASTAGLTGYPYVTAYSAAKHGVIGLTRALALEVAKKGITVNAVCPGYTNTDMATHAVTNIMEKTSRTEEQAVAALVQNNPQGRMIEPEEVAETVLWLCKKSSGSITGQSIAIAGGEIL